MASGLEGAAAVAGLISLAFEAFEGCLEAYQLFYSAQHIGRDGDAVRSKLDWERYRLVVWGERTGLHTHSPQERINWDLSVAFLNQQRALMTSADELEAKYSLRVPEETVNSKEMENAKSNETAFGKLLRRIKPEISQSSIRAIQSKNGTLKRLHWAAVGKKDALRIAAEIEEINNRLYSLLDTAEQERVQLATQALLRDLVSKSTKTDDLEFIQQLVSPGKKPNNRQIAAAAELKQIMAIVGRGDKQNDIDAAKLVKMGIKLKLLSTKKLKPRPGESRLECCGIELGKYRDTDVLIEWRTTDEEMWDLLAPQMRALAVLLGKMDSKAFPVLPCLGLISWKELDSFALVYDISTHTKKNATTKITTLQQLITEQPRASLNRRFHIALSLAESILQFHTAGWLHKGIRSENIFFLSNSDESPDKVLGETAYLIGFEYARPDNEDGQGLTRQPEENLLADLYRHPSARGADRQSYRKSFDLYALGCTLLELGLWKRLVHLHWEEHDLEDRIQRAKKEHKMLPLPSLLMETSRAQQIEELSHAAGERFASVVAECLTAGDTEDTKMDDSLEIQKSIVDTLRGCSC